MDSMQQPISANDEISLQELLEKLQAFWQYLKTKWFSFLITGIIGGLLGLGYYYWQTPKYTAECTFILEEKSGGGSSLAGLASQFGFDIGGGAGGSLFAGDNLLEIIPSRNIVEKVLLSKIDSTSEQTLADLYIDFTGLEKGWSKNEKLKSINFNKMVGREQMNLMQDSVLNLIYKNVVKSYLTVDWVRKKASLVKVSVTSKNEKFSKYLTERVVNEAKNLYISIKTGTSQVNVARLQRKADSLYALLNNKSYAAAEIQILNANPAMKQALVPVEISTRDKTVLGTIYAEVVKNLETNKILLSQQTPVIQMLDVPEFPLVKQLNSLPKTLLIAILILIIFNFITLIFLFIINNSFYGKNLFKN